MYRPEITVQLTEHRDEEPRTVNGEEIIFKYCGHCGKWFSTGQNTDGEWGKRTNKWLQHLLSEHPSEFD